MLIHVQAPHLETAGGHTPLAKTLHSEPFRLTPKPHQLEATAFCRNNKRVILADDMGVGKTLPAILASEGRTIVICPATVKANWQREILRERPGARVLILSGRIDPDFIVLFETSAPSLSLDGAGSPASSSKRLGRAAEIDFIILNYDIADAWYESLINWQPDTCICDEAHTCRNRRTARFQATLQIV